jgi:hypothetical protein
MPTAVLDLFELYLDGGQRNVSEVARLRGVPRSTVQKYSEVYRWLEHAAALDADTARAAITVARARDATLLASAHDTYAAALASRIGPDGKPEPGTPTVVALRAADRVYARHGLGPVHHATLTIHTAPPAAYSDAELDAMLARGDMASLLALAAGKAVPGGDAPLAATPPGDFTSGQPGGRGVPEPHPPVPRPADFGEAVVDAVFRDVGETDR